MDAAFARTTSVPARLDDIEHVVILVQENHSFDQYFGSYKGVRGFDDPHVLTQPVRDDLPIWYQFGWGPGDTRPDPGHYLLPFHLDTTDNSGNAICVDDCTHAWGAQHQSWNEGAMDAWVATHIAADGVAVGPQTMGYYTRQDIPFYYELADAFTICDGYHHSVMGPTTPNRVYTVSATLDPDGRGGGPITTNPGGSIPVPLGGSRTGYPSFTWTTMPEMLEQAGVSWKAYTLAGGQTSDAVSDSCLLYFKKFQDPSSVYFRKGVVPMFPGTFQADVDAGTLPSVSWVMSGAGVDEHPPSPPYFGDLAVTQQLLATLLAHPQVWEKTVLFVTYDENGGFFDHVPPPTAPAGTAGEWLTAPATVGSSDPMGPVGLGFRVPMLALSPYSAGGRICSDTFDHTSLLQFVETRFGVTVPNLSAWRRQRTGDLTATINLGAQATLPASISQLGSDAAVLAGTVPTAAQQSVGFVAENCVVATWADEAGVGAAPPAYPIPTNQTPPSQD